MNVFEAVMGKSLRCLTTMSVLLASACTVGPNYRPKDAGELGVPPSYVNAPGQPASPQELADWWHQFNDPGLNSLIGEAVGGNLDVAQAVARLRQSREALIQARAAFLPTLTGSAGVGRNFIFNGVGVTSNSFSLGGDASWQADLFGGISRNVEAARADAEGSQYQLAAAQVATIGDTAATYIQVREAQEQLAVARDTLNIASENLQIATWRNQAGLASSLDVEQARASRAQTAATIPSLQSALDSAKYRLAVLTGQAPGAIDHLVDQPKPIPAGPEAVAVGIPADTLRQRPDVRAAERSLASATARIGVAEAQLYPALQLTGNIGTSALTVGNFFNTITGSLFAGLAQTIFDGGRLRSQVRSQQAVADAAFAAYRSSVLTALEDVENGLVALETAKARQAEFAIAYEAANNSAILARSQYRAGLIDFQTLLTTENSLVSARNGLVTARADQALAIIQLYRALGGGWQPTSPGPGAI